MLDILPVRPGHPEAPGNTLSVTTVQVCAIRVSVTLEFWLVHQHHAVLDCARIKTSLDDRSASWQPLCCGWLCWRLTYQTRNGGPERALRTARGG
jgi:hypothetical protein